MRKLNLASRRRADGWRRSGVCVAIAAAALVAVGVAAPTVVLADGGLESQKGGLFHRKGWINPDIHRKNPSAPRKFAAARRSNLGGPPVSTPRSRPDNVASSTSRARKSKRRIPARIVRNREQKVTRTARTKSASKRVRVASLGNALQLPAESSRKRSASITGGGRIHWVASSGCVPGRLKAAIQYVSRNFGAVRVNSTCRSRRHNARVGGASRSYHLKGQAADFRVFGNIRAAARYLRGLAGGYRHYGGGLFHIDTGPRRSW